jgi:hypothetical protein
MFVALIGDRRATLPADWTRETAVALVAETSFDASRGAGPGLFSDVKITDRPAS